MITRKLGLELKKLKQTPIITTASKIRNSKKKKNNFPQDKLTQLKKKLVIIVQ